VRIGSPQSRSQLNTSWARDNNPFTAKPLSYNWTTSCCNAAVRVSGCQCNRTVRRCRNRRITRSRTENKVVKADRNLPDITFGKRLTVVPRTSRYVDIENVRIPTQITKHRIEWRDQLATRTRGVPTTTFSPLSKMVTNCSCYSPSCGCVGNVGCSCCAPACSCAPTAVQMSTSVSTHPVTESYIRRIPVRVPYEEKVV